jgi:hypothetical protein
MAAHIKDRTALVPIVLFVILAGVVASVMIKNSRRNRVVRMEEEVIYVRPAGSL